MDLARISQLSFADCGFMRSTTKDLKKCLENAQTEVLTLSLRQSIELLAKLYMLVNSTRIQGPNRHQLIDQCNQLIQTVREQKVCTGERRKVEEVMKGFFETEDLEDIERRSGS